MASKGCWHIETSLKIYVGGKLLPTCQTETRSRAPAETKFRISTGRDLYGSNERFLAKLKQSCIC
jgi:hypothetical protein